MSDDISDVCQGPWFGEEPAAALLLVMVLHHCATEQPDRLDSKAILANAEAMIACAEDGCIDLTGEAGGRLFAVVRPRGWALIERHRAEQTKDDHAATQAWIARVIRDYWQSRPAHERVTETAKLTRLAYGDAADTPMEKTLTKLCRDEAGNEP